MIDLLTPSHKIDPSPKPWPDRDWSRMPGKFLDPANIRSMKPDTLHRDRYSEAERLAAWKQVNDMHMWAREHNPGIPKEHGIYLLSASMGGGKSMWAIGIALMAWAHRAIPVFSSESMGALFGYQLSLEQVYLFPDVVPPGSIVLVDEISALADAHSGQAMRGRTLYSSMTGFRKGGNLAITMTAAEAMLAWQLRVSMQAVIEPYLQRPKRQKLMGYSMTGKPQYTTYTLRENELDYPPFCYLQARAISQPWEGKRVHEDRRAWQEKQEMSDSQRRRAKGSKWKTESVRSGDPMLYDLAGKLYDTYQRVPISDQHSLSAGRMREASELARAGGRFDTEDVLRAFARWAAIDNRVFIQFEQSGWIPWRDVYGVATNFSKEIFETISEKNFKKMFREVLPKNDSTSQRLKWDALFRYAHSG